jgi:hypothetical protein
VTDRKSPGVRLSSERLVVKQETGHTANGRSLVLVEIIIEYIETKDGVCRKERVNYRDKEASGAEDEASPTTDADIEMSRQEDGCTEQTKCSIQRRSGTKVVKRCRGGVAAEGRVSSLASAL